MPTRFWVDNNFIDAFAIKLQQLKNLNLGFCQTSIESEVIKVTEAPFYTILFAFSYMKYKFLI